MDVLDLLDAAADNTAFYQINEDKMYLSDSRIRALIDIAKAAREVTGWFTPHEYNYPVNKLREALTKLGGGDD